MRVAQVMKPDPLQPHVADQAVELAADGVRVLGLTVGAAEDEIVTVVAIAS